MSSPKCTSELLPANAHQLLEHPDKLRGQLHSHGFIQFCDAPPTVPTREIAGLFAAAIGAAAFRDIETLRPTDRAEMKKNTYGGNFGTDEFPLHSDLAHWFAPPRYILLRCVVGSASVATRLLHVEKLAHYVPLQEMQNALLSPRRPLGDQLFLLPMLDHEILRWDSLFLVPKNLAARRIQEKLSLLPSHSACKNAYLCNAGDGLILDNWRLLHGRSPVPTCGKDRILERIYMDEE